MKTVVRFITIAGVLLVCMFLLSASTWEGTAILGSYGDFPANGYYAACNSFSRNTVVEVTNVDNGRKVSVIITRGLDNAGVFMLLSAEAAQALGVMQGVVARVSASEPKSATELNSTKKTGTAAFDPDFDPKRMAESELKKLGYVVETAPVAAPVAAAPVTPAPVAAAPVTPAPVATAPVTAVPVAPAPVAAAPAASVSSTASPDSSAARITPPASGSAKLPAPVVENFKPVEKPKTVPAAAQAITEAPMVINGKPKPVRTIILAALPEPQAAPPAPAAAVVKVPETAPALAPATPAPISGTKPEVSTAVQKAPTSAMVMVAPVAPAAAVEKPEVISKPMPTPDETPVIVKKPQAPKRLESASIYPDTYIRTPSIPMVGETPVITKVNDPTIMAAQTLDRSKPGVKPLTPMVSLAEPAVPRAERAIVLDKNGRPVVDKNVIGSLIDPAAPKTETASVLDRNGLKSASGTVSGELRDPSAPLVETASVVDRNGLRGVSGTVDGELRDPSAPLVETASVLDRNGLLSASGTVSGELRDPSAPLVETASVLDRNGLQSASGTVSGELRDPTAPLVETANVLDLSRPGYYTNGLAVDLALPELVPDALPEIVLRSLAGPKLTIPETNLAEGEIQFAEEEKAMAISLDTPYYDAAETVVALAEANEKAAEKPVASIQGPVPAGTPLSMGLADAAEQKAETAPGRPAPLVATKTALPPIALADATVAPKTAAAAVQAPVTVQPAPVVPGKGDTVVTLTPTGPKAPGAVEPIKPAAAPIVSVPGSQGALASAALKKDFFYIQLAAYGSEQAVREAAGKLGKKYITIIEPITVKGKSMFRLYVGPLSRDESGVALVQVRALGFKDAFIKQGG